jgi:hypothetical protein
MKRKQDAVRTAVNVPVWTAGSVAKVSGKAFGDMFNLPMTATKGVAQASSKSVGGLGKMLELHAKRLVRRR